MNGSFCQRKYTFWMQHKLALLLYLLSSISMWPYHYDEDDKGDNEDDFKVVTF